MIVVSMANALSLNGEFCAGPKEVIDYQRLLWPAYCLSASIPAMLAVCASEVINILEINEERSI